MPSLHRKQSNTNKKQKFSNDISNIEHEPKVNSNEPTRAQKELIISEANTKSIKRKKNVPKSGANIEINKKCLDKIVHNKHL